MQRSQWWSVFFPPKLQILNHQLRLLWATRWCYLYWILCTSDKLDFSVFKENIRSCAGSTEILRCRMKLSNAENGFEKWETKVEGGIHKTSNTIWGTISEVFWNQLRIELVKEELCSVHVKGLKECRWNHGINKANFQRSYKSTQQNVMKSQNTLKYLHWSFWSSRSDKMDCRVCLIVQKRNCK